MMAIFRHLIELVLNPFFLIVLLFAAFLITLWFQGNGRLVRYGFLAIFILLAFFSTGWLARGITSSLENQYTAVTKVDPSVHWVVVLSGGQANLTNLPANSLLYTVSIKRLVEGLRLYRQLPEAKLLLSGGGYGFEVPEAEHLAELAAWFAITKKDIILETKSINTLDEAKEIKKLVHDEPFYLVTSAIHMPRSMGFCQAQGLHPIPAPTDYTLYWNDERWTKTYLPNPHNLYYLTIAMHELLGRAWAKILGHFPV